MTAAYTTPVIKDILAKKFKEEGTYFTKSHIKVKRIKDGYKIIVDDYTHIPFTVKMYEDEDLGYTTVAYADTDCIYFHDSKFDYNEFSALMYIGYYVGTRF